jgi:hypothetical protein
MNLRVAFKLLRSAALASGLALALAGCETLDFTNLIPDSKKKLPGERREVFPGGVPGVSQGVPPELMKGYQAQPETAAAEEQKPAEPEKKPAAKPKPKPRVAKPTPTVAPEYQQDAQQPQPNQGQWPGQKPAQQSAWPQSPQPGTFSR